MKNKICFFSTWRAILSMLLTLWVCCVNAQYVTKSNQQFIYQGNPVTLYGCSFDPAAEGYTAAWRSTSFPATIHKDITNAVAAGQNIMRPTDFWDNSTSGQSYTNDPVMWSNMDFLLADCKTNGMFVLMDISAWKLVLDQEGKSETDTNNWLPFIDWVTAKYKTNTTIAFWSIMGEPSVPTNSSSASALVSFYDVLTTRLHSDDPNHLVCAGGFNHMNENTNLNWWQDIFALSHNDIDAYKTYSQNDLNLTPTIGRVAASHNKILINEEFGMPQSQGDGTWSGQTENGLSTSVSTFFTNVYNAGLSAGAVGFQFWNLDDNQGSGNYDIWPSYMPVTWATIKHYAPNTSGGGGSPSSISINFSGMGGTGTNMAASESAGVIMESNWNNAVGLSGSNQVLNDSTGASSGATLTFDDPKSYNQTTIANTPGDYRMMKFYLDSSTNTTTTVTVTNLSADSNGYKVYVYFDGNNGGETREGQYQISGTGITTTTIDGFDNANTDFGGTFTQANNDAGNYVLFTIGNVSAFNLSATAVNNGAVYPRGPLNGIQIVPQ